MLKPYYETELGKLYNADCLDILPDISSDVLLTDPIWPNNSVHEFQGIDPYKLFAGMLAVLNPVKRICVQLGCDSDPRILAPITLKFLRVYWLRFALPGHSGRILKSGDVAYLFGEPPKVTPGRKLLRGEKTSTNNFGKEANHPCPRKKEHVKFLIEDIARHGEIVLDPFIGSGTTGVVCEGLGINWIGIEREQKYCDIAIDRLKNEVQYELF